MAKEAFGPEAQKFIDKVIYAKMPDHVKKLFNRAFLEDKRYNEFVLLLDRDLRLNGLGARRDHFGAIERCSHEHNESKQKAKPTWVLLPLWQIWPL